ncbi:Early nodulin-like protein 1 [Rhynchospora pubera]|uniref:Early nodulin-like protein 1 n=1 Tax=Rhynchospora pubera TaxID=906938 RepID=A0AAV8DJZ7_9POAL|nr:Early nodulin-like protein 1 [Rhynchospora pubera]
MERMNMVVALVVLLGLAGTSTGAVYKVGDSAGWTIMGNVNYDKWVSKKEFLVNDVVVFTYNSNFHNVLEVSKADYQSCNNESPIATYATGNDSIPLKTAGPHYFLCGIPGHCASGQKVEINVQKGSSAAPSMAPVEAPAPDSGAESSSANANATATSAPTPNSNGAASTGFSVGVGIMLLLASLCF